MLCVGREGKTSENDMSTRIIGGVSYPMDLWQNEAAQQFIPAVMVTHSQLATIGAPVESDTYLVDETGLPYKWSTSALAWVALFPNSLVPGPSGTNGTNGTNGVSPVMSIGTVSSGSPAACTLTGTSAAPVLNLVIPPGTNGINGTNGSNGANNTLAIGAVTQGTAAATITGTSPNQTLNLVLPKGDPGTAGTNGTNGTNATVTGYQNTALKTAIIAAYKSAVVASGVAVFQLTVDGLSTGTAIFPNEVFGESIQLIVNDATASYQFGWTLTNSNKTLTVTANKLGTANILTGILGQVAAPNGTVVNLTIKGR